MTKAMSGRRLLLDKAKFLVLTILLLLLTPQVSQAVEDRWLSEIVNEMLTLQVKGWGNFQPYLGQLQAARVALRKGDDAAAHAALNQFMNMLEIH